jgi:LysM repeat protein
VAWLSHFYRNTAIIINPRLILEIPTDPDSSKRWFLRKFGLNNSFARRFGLKKLFLLLLILVLPVSVSGSFLSGIFKSASAETSTPEKNIQNMALLAASSPLADSSSAPTIDSDALVSNTGPSGSAAEVMNHKPQSDQISVYVVREGDTLSQIAEMFNVTVNTIKWGNDLSSNTVRPGDTLVILPISGIKHLVKKGDTLESIAKEYNGDVDEIASYNSLASKASLSVGTTIIVPDGEASIPSSNPSSSGGSSGSSGVKEYAGYYSRPIVGGMKTQGLHGHNAVDLGAPAGTKILAAAAGEVIISRAGGWNGGYGNYIVIRHNNGTQTLYAHNSANYVSAGDKVEQGEVIGAVGHTGSVSGPTGNHLHFEIRGAKNPF